MKLAYRMTESKPSDSASTRRREFLHEPRQIWIIWAILVVFIHVIAILSRIESVSSDFATWYYTGALSLRLDGEVFPPATASVDDVTGKVVYRRPNGQGLTTAYVYIAHQ